jgi:hypothetical protein
VFALAPYPTSEERERELETLAEHARAELRTYGHSVEGRPLRAAVVPSRASTPRARVLCAANIHGVEWIGNRVAHGLLAACAAPPDDLAALLDEAELWIAPCLNPDGYARTEEREGRGRMKDLRTNANGVDLNRNFPPPPGRSYGRFPGAGSGDDAAATYRGTAPLSEPEASHLAALLDEVHFAGSVSLHSFMGTLITPRVPEGEDYRAYGELCRAFRAAQPGARYRRLSSRVFDMFTGELEDHQHHVHGTWATCVECFPIASSIAQHVRAPSLFWRMNPRDPQRWVDNDVPGVVAWLRAAIDRPAPAGR